MLLLHIGPSAENRIIIKNLLDLAIHSHSGVLHLLEISSESHRPVHICLFLIINIFIDYIRLILVWDLQELAPVEVLE